MTTRRGTMEARLERLEQRLVELPRPTDLPLSRLEVAELARLERERAERFPGEIADWPMELIDEFMAYQSDSNGAAARLAHLRERARTPEQRAADRAVCAAIDLMSPAALDEYMAIRSLEG